MDVLVSHDGELADVCQLLREQDVDLVERVGAVPVAELARAWDVVVATPVRVARLGAAIARPETRTVVVAEPGTRAAGRRLQLHGVDWIAYRPFHPAALRLLLQHALYAGPERRSSLRVALGLPVLYRAGWLPRRALLREVSLRGASLVARHRLAPGRRVALHVRDEGVRLRLDAEVVRSRPAPGGAVELGLAFETGPALPLVELRRLIDRHARAPGAAARCEPASARPRDGVAARRPGAAGAPAADGAPRRAPDRRESPRRHYDRRVIALGDGPPRVLIGRDLSLGGMRIESGEPLAPGEKVRVALHVGAGAVPLVVDAEVVRIEGALAGLRFAALSEDGRAYLGRMLDDLPALAAPSPARPAEPRILAEVLRPPPRVRG